MVNIWLLEFRVPPLHAKNKNINTGEKEKAKKENFIYKFLSLQVGIFIEMFLCYFDNVNYFSPSKVESL